MAERIYAGSYVPDEDPLVQISEKVRATQDAALLAKLEKAVRAQGWRYRGWMELAAIQRDVFANPAAACSALQEGAQAVEDPQDAAMLLYRAAHVAQDAMRDDALANSLRRKAAADFPKPSTDAKPPPSSPHRTEPRVSGYDGPNLKPLSEFCRLRRQELCGPETQSTPPNDS